MKNEPVEPVAASPALYLGGLRHRTPSSHRYASPKRYISPSPYRAYSSLSSGGKSVLLVKRKVSSCSSFLLSMHVVLKTRHVSPISTYVDIRSTYVAQTYLPLVRNFYPYVEQQPKYRSPHKNIGHLTKLYSFAPKAI